MKRLAIVLAAALLLGGCTATPIQSPESTSGADPSTMQDVCIDKVAIWAGISTSDVSGRDLSHENPSGEAWDFEGEYLGGTWRCGGPAGQPDPASVMVYPDAGPMQDIVDGGVPPQSPDAESDDPEDVLAALIAASPPASTACLSAMSALADTPYSASEATAEAAIAVTVEDCTTAAEYILAFKEYPAAWGVTDASYIDGSSALITILSACYNNDSAPMCVDAEANGLL